MTNFVEKLFFTLVEVACIFFLVHFAKPNWWSVPLCCFLLLAITCTILTAFDDF